MNDRFEQRWMSPLDVVEHDDERAIDAQVFEQLPEPPSELFLRKRACRKAHRR